MTRPDHRLMACTGKVRFDSYTQADRVRGRRSVGIARNVYHCKLCNGYHVGTAPPKSGRPRVPRETIR